MVAAQRQQQHLYKVMLVVSLQALFVITQFIRTIRAGSLIPSRMVERIITIKRTSNSMALADAQWVSLRPITLLWVWVATASNLVSIGT